MFDFGIVDVWFGLYPAECRVNYRDGRYQYLACVWDRACGRMRGPWRVSYTVDATVGA